MLVVAGCQFEITGADLGVGLGDGGGGSDLAGAADFGDAGRAFDLSLPDGVVVGGLAYPCARAQECRNGLCVDGYCCDELCDPALPQNLCKACNVPGLEGRCVLASPGTDPRGQCPQQPSTSCGRDGTCDGQGACRRWRPGTACGVASCAGGRVTYAPACDGQGACVPSATSPNCDPYVCASATACTTSCSLSGGGCAGGVVCVGTSCGQFADGQPCTANGQCQSNACAQGVCCQTSCSGLCRSCNIPGFVGRCVLAAAGTDPRGQCTFQPRTSCAQTGECDGAGHCQLWPAGTMCLPQRCSAGAVATPAYCNGSGTCVPGVSSSCAPYTCDPASISCFSFCAPDGGQCAASAQCLGDQCQ